MSTETRKHELKAAAERQTQTRRRIVEATEELHQEVGPARTTVAEIARRAGVRRLTVYDHFPEDSGGARLLDLAAGRHRADAAAELMADAVRCLAQTPPRRP